MNLFRFVILGLLAWFVFRVVRSLGSDDSPNRPRRRQTLEDFEMMARCTGCGVFVPRDSLNDSGRCRNCQKRG
ncbi:MAG: hypothetical protein OSA97_12935 [Nevskia sp.]|nr:hypothetical protein [Nevskia sp.]